MVSSRDSSNAHFTKFFFEKAFPDPQDKNFHTQLGVHFEEIRETLEQLKPRDGKSEFMLKLVHDACLAMSMALKEGQVTYDIKDRVEFLDGLCDQMVTAVGVGHMAGMDIAPAFGEVNESNDSKFGPDGKPIYDENLKMMKGPDYFKPDLKPFV